MGKPNFYFMSGEDRLSMLQEIVRWKRSFIEKYGNSDLEELDGEHASLEQIAGAIQAVPFLSPKRLVILSNFLSTHKAEEANALLPALEKLSDETILLLAETKEPDKRTGIVKAITQIASQRLFVKPKGATLTLWVKRRAESLGVKISSSTIDALIRWAGEDLFALQNELEKCALFASAQSTNGAQDVPEITPSMIDELVADNVQKSIFTLTDQLSQKNHAGALDTLKKLQNQGEEAGYLFAMITRQFRLLLEIKALSEEGQNPSLIAKTMGVHPFVVQNTLRYSRSFSTQKLKPILEGLLVLDKRLKTGLISLKAREEDPFLLELEKLILSA
jgi:DNA polymerase III subunit delta